MSTASREKCCSIGVQIMDLQEYKMQYTQARITGALQFTSPTIELYNEITELQENQYSESKYNTKDKSGQNDKKERTFMILYLFYETIILGSSS